MLDQTFTADNFRRIFDLESRKGVNLEERFFPALQAHTDQLSSTNEAIRTLYEQRATLPKEQFEQLLGVLLENKKALKVAKDAAIMAELESLGESIRTSGFRLCLEKKSRPGGKDVYPIEETPCGFFVVKQLQRNLNKLYKVKQSDRFQQVSRVADVLCARFPCEVVRTDIQSFYESVDRVRLSKKINEDHLLNLASKKFIRQILDSYAGLSGLPNGIPRGVGVSAYLGELYLRPLDKLIASLNGLILYARYVDDIVAIFAPPPEGKPIIYKDEVIKAIQAQGLQPNLGKTAHYVIGPKSKIKFEYLGYRFKIEKSSCTIGLSAKKVRKYAFRLAATFTAYERDSHLDARKADKLLTQRIKFLTGNTRLVNNKSHAVTGIFYNNSAATDFRALSLLDQKLARKVAGLPSIRLRQKLSAFTFSRGFQHRMFHTYTTKRLQAIVRAWSDAA